MKYLPVSQKGQAILLVLLSMAVALTMVLSVLSRSLTDIKITSQDEASQRAFSAAEAGIEQALVGGTLSGNLEDNTAYQAMVTGYSSYSPVYVSPQGLLSGDRAIVWFVAHNSAGNLECTLSNPCFTGNKMKVCWGLLGTGSSDPTTPALEVSIFYAATPADYATVRIARAAFDPSLSRRAANSFSAPDAGTCNIGGENYQFQKTLDFSLLGIPVLSSSSQNGLQFATLRILYNTDITHEVGVDVTGGSNLPSQGTVISSLGTSGEANRKIEVIQSIGELPPVFGNAVFSLGGLSK